MYTIFATIYVKFWFYVKSSLTPPLVCLTSPMVSLNKSTGGPSKYFYQGLWLADANADVIGQSTNKHEVALEFPHHVTVSSSFLHDFVWISIQIPEGINGPMEHETSTRCYASRSVKQSSPPRCRSRWYRQGPVKSLRPGLWLFRAGEQPAASWRCWLRQPPPQGREGGSTQGWSGWWRSSSAQFSSLTWIEFEAVLLPCSGVTVFWAEHLFSDSNFSIHDLVHERQSLVLPPLLEC